MGDKAPTSAQLKDDIEKGKTGDKIGYPDPGASPLGTDAEAGGNPPSKEEMEIARREEAQRPDGPKAEGERPTSLDDD